MTATSAQEAQVAEKVERLHNLYEGPHVIADIVKEGDAAVPALERLLCGPSDSLHHSRCWAADALAAIGSADAVRALVRSLRDCADRVPNVMCREAEDVVVSTIADHLGQFSDTDVLNALLSALDKRAYPGCARALGRLGNSKAIPPLVRSLLDDTTRRAASEALRELGPSTVPQLAALLRGPRLVNGAEPPSYIDGRIAAASLIGSLLPHAVGIISDSDRDTARRTLSAALRDSQRTVRLAAALSLTRCSQGRALGAVRMLVNALDDPNWRNTTNIMHVLTRLGPQIEEPVLEAIATKGGTEADLRRQRRAIWIAGQMDSSAAVSSLGSLSSHPNVQIRMAAVRALNNNAKAGFAALHRYLDDPEAAVRRMTLGMLCQGRAMTIEDTARLLGDPDEEIRRLATARIGEERGEALPVLGRAVLSLGKPLDRWPARLRLTWYALRWLAVKNHRHRTPLQN